MNGVINFVNLCDVKSAEKRYACLKIVNNNTKMNMTCVSSHRCLRSLVVRKKGAGAKGFYFPRGNKSFYAKQNCLFYLFDKSWYFSAKHVTYMFMS